MIYYEVCYVVVLSFLFNHSNASNVNSRNNVNSRKAIKRNQTLSFVRSLIQRRPVSNQLQNAIVVNHQNWKKKNLINFSNNFKKRTTTNKSGYPVSKNNIFKRWPLRSPYDVAMDSGPALKFQYWKSKMQNSPPAFHSKRKFDENIHSRSSIIPCLYVPMGTRKECIESNQQEQSKNAHNRLTAALNKDFKTVNTGEISSHENTKLESSSRNQEKSQEELGANKSKDQKLDEYFDSDEKDINPLLQHASPSTNEIAIQKMKDEEAQKILHSSHENLHPDYENVGIASFHKQKTTKEDKENEKDEQSSKNQKESSGNHGKESESDDELQEKVKNKDKELKMKAMKLRLKDEDNFEDQLKTVENNIKNESNKNEKNNEEDKLKFKNTKFEKNDLENNYKSDKENGPQNIAEMKDESNPQTENEEKKLRKEMLKSKAKNEQNEDEQSKLLKNKLEEQSIDHTIKNDPRPEENTAEVEDALINSQPHKINIENQEKLIRPQQLSPLTPSINPVPCHNCNQYRYEHNVDNQFFKLWREDLLIKQKFIERMTNMDTKYLGLLYKISKSLDSISHTLTNGFKVMNNVMGEQMNTPDLLDKHYPAPSQLSQKPPTNNGLNYF